MAMLSLEAALEKIQLVQGRREVEQGNGFPCVQDEFFEVGLSCGTVANDEDLVTLQPSDVGEQYVYEFVGKHYPDVEKIPKSALVAGAYKKSRVIWVQESNLAKSQ